MCVPDVGNWHIMGPIEKIILNPLIQLLEIIRCKVDRWCGVKTIDGVGLLEMLLTYPNSTGS
jgi:hypothetical protein